MNSLPAFQIPQPTISNKSHHKFSISKGTHQHNFHCDIDFPSPVMFSLAHLCSYFDQSNKPKQGLTLLRRFIEIRMETEYSLGPRGDIPCQWKFPDGFLLSLEDECHFLEILWSEMIHFHCTCLSIDIFKFQNTIQFD